MQLPFLAFTPQKQWTPPRFEQWPAFRRAKRICIDLENNDEKLRVLGPGCYRTGFYVAGVGIAIDGGPRQYIPLRHKGGDNIEDPELFWSWFKEEALEFEGDIVNCHIAYDLKWLAAKGIKFPKMRRAYDPIIMDTLVYELHPRADLGAIAGRWGVPGKDKTHLVQMAKAYGLKNPMAEMHKLPARDVVDYNIGDLEMPLAVFPRIWAKLEQMDCLPLLDIETRLTPILVDMYGRGIRINRDKLDAMEVWYRREEQLCCDQLTAMTGETVMIGDCGNSNRIGPVLERHTGVTLPRSKEKKPKVLLDDALLTALEDKHPAFKIAHRARKLDTARAFCPQTRDLLCDDGRIRPSYNQTRSTEDTVDEDLSKDLKPKGARTGRMSCEDPNITQWPSRDEWSKDWRDIAEPEEGMDWWSADFAQQEPRLVTADAARFNLPKARETARAFLTNELLDNHKFMSELTGVARKPGKQLYLGRIYGMGDSKLCHKLKLPTRWCVFVGDWKDQKKHYFGEEWEAMAFRMQCTDEKVSVREVAGEAGQKIIDTFNTRAPFLGMIAALAKKDGRKHGVIRTILNRHLHLPMKPNGEYDWLHATLNMRVQGSGADQMKLSMVKSVEAMPDLWLQLQIHDAQGGSIEKGKLGRERAKEIGRIMRNAWTDEWMLYRVDVAIGPSWGREHDMCYNQYCTEDSFSSDEKWCAAHAPKAA